MKNTIIKGIALFIGVLSMSDLAYGKEVIGLPPGGKGRSHDVLQRKAAGCTPATQQSDLDINNVRARILNGGDMWWDLNSVARYEVPKLQSNEQGVRKNSMFAGAIWIGGVDLGGNLKVAAMTYRQDGNDYFPGALDTSTGEIEPSRCKYYDKLYKVDREEIEDFVRDPSIISDGIAQWPGNGDPFYGEARILAPFFDANGDGFYDVSSGTEYPVLDASRAAVDNKPEDQPDQMIYFIYNDKGNIHKETNGIPIGLELQTTAFAFATNDEINNMTFYKTKVTNRSFDEVRNCYFGQWVDADLGNYADDYVGCDTTRNLGYCYNGDDNDEGILGYGSNPPSVGTTFFEGPRDSAGNEIGLSKFVYYNNDWSVTGNPQAAEHYYNYLRGIWKDGSPITENGTGHQSGGGPTSFMFPGDPTGSGWNERTAGNTPGDRRYLQSAGPFNLKPGQVNYVTIGVVWAKTTSGGATGSLNLLKLASDKAQQLFNNNFRILDGPPAPTLDIKELDGELIFTMVDADNFRLSNIENFSITTEGSSGPLIYRFQGYKIYQLASSQVSTGELDNVERARLLLQCDLQDQYDRVINQILDPNLGVPIPREMVNGANQGIVHSFKITEDLFATGATQLVNFKSYYYIALAYAVCVNNPNEPIQYLEGRLNIEPYRAVPHRPDPTSGGTRIKSEYGSGPAIKVFEGAGNGGNYLELTQQSIEEILRPPYTTKTPLYLGGKGPVNIKVIDPLKVPVADFELRIIDSTVIDTIPGNQADSLIPAKTVWWLYNKTSGDTVFSDTSIDVLNEHVINKWGISVTVNQPSRPGIPNHPTDNSNGYLGADMVWQDDAKQWLTGLEDNDGSVVWLNWIRSGTNGRNAQFDNQAYQHDFAFSGEALDPFEKYEDILGGIIAPYALAARAGYQSPFNVTYGPAYASSGIGTDNRLSDLQSVDLVLTPDRTKWTRCLVIETGEDPALSVGNAAKHTLRKSPSLNSDLKTVDPSGETGRSWFPGYAVNVETGQRLNIMFGEDSYLSGQNGNDMIWNPTSNLVAGNNVTIGGKHYIYIMGSKLFGGKMGPIYDEGNTYMQQFKSGTPNDLRSVYAQCMWVMPAMLEEGYSMTNGVPPTEVRIKLRVKRPYVRADRGNPILNNEMPRFEFNTADIAPERNANLGKNAMELINVVPNPYYGYSAYESSQLDNRIKIINLPPKCTINVFNLSGTLVRQIKKDDENTYVDWDLKNHVNVPIASGMYIIHVDGGDLGEKIIKWFGVMRQIDLDSF